jgi:hypothetical protein
MASLLDLADARLRGLLDIPTRAARAVVNPTLFSGLLGAPTIPKEMVAKMQGTAEAAASLPAKENMSVLDPTQAAYMEGYAAGEPFGFATMAAPMLGGATKLVRNPKFYKEFASPLLRPLNAPQISTEAAQTPTRTLLNAMNDPIAEGLSRRRFELGATDPLKQNVSYRQGVWESESNPMFLSTMPKTVDSLLSNKEFVRNLVQTAENLEQAGAGAIRTLPMPFTKNLNDGDVAILSMGKKGLSNKQVSELGKSLGDKGAIQHRQDGTAVLVSFGDDLQTLFNKVKKDLPDLKAKPAISEDKVDRLYFERQEYPNYGAIPRDVNPAINELKDFDELLRSLGYRE